MFNVPTIHQPIADAIEQHLEEVARVFERQLASELSAVNRLCLHVENYRGKMLRPMLVLLSGMVARPEIAGTQEYVSGQRVLSAVVEMIHMATLVHDDVLDEADVRRQGSTVNHLWGNETAVMLGDYLISNAFHLCSSLGDPSVNLALGEVTNTICEGELLQLHHRDDLGLDEDTYFQIIRRKTASLIGGCCSLGARIVDAADDAQHTLGNVGMALGIAFQIQDDLLDLTGSPELVGKTLGRDLAKGKMTLPLIRFLDRCSQDDRGRALQLIRQLDDAGLSKELLDSGAIDDAREAARKLVEQGKAGLAELPESPARDLFCMLADSVVTRAH